ncbi:MAG: virulence RhuM family protein [Deltaproteobacteria bacterium]|nr:virulence RhuM family protein [Deltaproteobacteria bacterium]
MPRKSNRSTEEPLNSSELILYQTEDGKSRLEVRLEGNTVWLSQKQLSELFLKDVRTISEHLRNIFEEGELHEDSVIRKFRITAADGKNYETLHYNLDVIISVGYRVKSPRGTQFRIWATQRLREFIVKGFTLDDDRLKEAGGDHYFEELLERIRDIRSSEKVFWRKVLDIYATSIDYDPSVEMTQQFFATVQNKMHWAAHGQTAAEVISQRADASLPHMGLTSWEGSRPRKSDVGVAKNYLQAEELDALNRIVTAYLEFAELQARSRRLMYMQDWIAKLDDFLRLSERDILTHAGKISQETAIEIAERQYEQFSLKKLAETSPVEIDFLESIRKIENLIPARSSKKKTRKTQ